VQGNTQRLYGGTVTADGNTHDTPIKCRFSQEATFLFDITAIAGALNVEIQTYNPLTGNWHKLAVFDEKTTIMQDEGFIDYGIGEKLAIEYTTTGSATFTMDVHLK
jgi:hypothetical protein